MSKNSRRRSARAFYAPSAMPLGEASRAGAALARRALQRPADRVARAGAREIAMRPLGQLCPICHEGSATVEMRMGPLYSKICEPCFNSGMHVLKLLGKLSL